MLFMASSALIGRCVLSATLVAGMAPLLVANAPATSLLPPQSRAQLVHGPGQPTLAIPYVITGTPGDAQHRFAKEPGRRLDGLSRDVRGVA